QVVRRFRRRLQDFGHLFSENSLTMDELGAAVPKERGLWPASMWAVQLTSHRFDESHIEARHPCRGHSVHHHPWFKTLPAEHPWQSPAAFHHHFLELAHLL